MNTDKQLIEKTVRNYFDAFNKSDTEEIIKLYTEDGAIMADEFATVIGHEQIRSVFTWAFKEMKYQFEYVIDRVLIVGTMASVHAHANGTITTLSTGKTVIAHPHRELFVLQKLGNEWKITDYMFNRNENKKADK